MFDLADFLKDLDLFELDGRWDKSVANALVVCHCVTDIKRLWIMGNLGNKYAGIIVAYESFTKNLAKDVAKVIADAVNDNPEVPNVRVIQLPASDLKEIPFPPHFVRC